MKLTNIHINIRVILLLLLCQILTYCDSEDIPADDETGINMEEEEQAEEEEEESVDFLLPDIDLNNWKVTLPVGGPDEVEPPEILDYGTNETLLPYMYNDSTDGSLVFYTFPGSSTPNSTYSRTELREQMRAGSNSINWTFAEGGRMRGTLSVPFVSPGQGGSNYRVIIMQIHGRLTNDQRDLIGENDNNAPPILKIYWNDGRIQVNTKELKDLGATIEELLHTSAWTDDDARFFSDYVGTEKFTLEVIASNGRLEVILNDGESFVYEDVHMQKWNVFENYFKAGNYLLSQDSGTSSIVKYYDLQVEH